MVGAILGGGRVDPDRLAGRAQRQRPSIRLPEHAQPRLRRPDGHRDRDRRVHPLDRDEDRTGAEGRPRRRHRGVVRRRRRALQLEPSLASTSVTLGTPTIAKLPAAGTKRPDRRAVHDQGQDRAEGPAGERPLGSHRRLAGTDRSRDRGRRHRRKRTDRRRRRDRSDRSSGTGATGDPGPSGATGATGATARRARPRRPPRPPTPTSAPAPERPDSTGGRRSPRLIRSPASVSMHPPTAAPPSSSRSRSAMWSHPPASPWARKL